MKENNGLSRRQVLVALASSTLINFSALANSSVSQELQHSTNSSPEKLARDENYWKKVADFYDKTTGIVNLEHGYWGKMSKPVLEYYQQATRMVNAQNSFYARKDYKKDLATSVKHVADALGVEADEIVLTRNATEAVQNLIRQYRGLKTGDSVLYADIDYPTYKKDMAWMQKARGIKSIKVELPVRANQKQLLDLYIKAFDENPSLKMMLVTHVSNQHGMRVPVKEITIEARKRGIDVISDCAQSWGLIDYKMDELNVDFAVFNLHKWIGSPVGVGALYIRKSAFPKIAPYMGEADENKIESRVHVATSNFAAMISVPTALDFHHSIGEKNKQARLSYLRSLWTIEAEKLDNIEVLGGTDEASCTGMGSFRLRGKTSIDDAKELQLRIEKEFGVFTVVRKGLASGGCVRVTPQVFNTPDEIQLLVKVLKKIDQSQSS